MSFIGVWKANGVVITVLFWNLNSVNKFSILAQTQPL